MQRALSRKRWWVCGILTLLFSWTPEGKTNIRRRRLYCSNINRDIQPNEVACRFFAYYNRLTMVIPKFSNTPHSFHTELKTRISAYFEQVGKSTTGDFKIFSKAVILMVAFLFVYIHLVFFYPECFFLHYRKCVVGLCSGRHWF